MTIPDSMASILIDAGKLPAYKVDRDVMLRQADIDGYRRNQRPTG